MIGQDQFIYFLLENIRKTNKIIEDQGNREPEVLQFLNPNKQLYSIQDLFSKEFFNKEAKDELAQLKTQEQQIIRGDLIQKPSNKKLIKHINF